MNNLRRRRVMEWLESNRQRQPLGELKRAFREMNKLNKMIQRDMIPEIDDLTSDVFLKEDEEVLIKVKRVTSKIYRIIEEQKTTRRYFKKLKSLLTNIRMEMDEDDLIKTDMEVRKKWLAEFAEFQEKKKREEERMNQEENDSVVTLDLREKLEEKNEREKSRKSIEQRRRFEAIEKKREEERKQREREEQEERERKQREEQEENERSRERKEREKEEREKKEREKEERERVRIKEAEEEKRQLEKSREILRRRQRRAGVKKRLKYERNRMEAAQKIKDIEEQHRQMLIRMQEDSADENNNYLLHPPAAIPPQHASPPRADNHQRGTKRTWDDDEVEFPITKRRPDSPFTLMCQTPAPQFNTPSELVCLRSKSESCSVPILSTALSSTQKEMRKLNVEKNVNAAPDKPGKRRSRRNLKLDPEFRLKN